MAYQTYLGGTMTWLVTSVALLLPLFAAAELQMIPRDQRLPVLQGATNASSAQFSILYPGTDRPDVAVVVEQDGRPQHLQMPARHSSIRWEDSDWQAIKVLFRDLAHGPDHYLEIKDSTGILIDRRQFRLLNTGAHRVRLAFVSCSSDEFLSEQGPMWRRLVDSRPDLLIMLGDNVYVDRPRWTHPTITAPYIWQRYIETRNSLDIYKTAQLIPTLATWDDHDYGKNNTDKAFPHKQQAAEIFRAMYAQDPIIPEIVHGPGVATYFSAFAQKFFLMDDRTFRSCKWFWCKPQSHWGEEQFSWVLNNIGESTDPVWLVNGSQFFGSYRGGWSFEGNHGQRFERVLERLRQAPAPILFASGDVHYSEIMRIEQERLGYTSYEVTSSAIHSRSRSPRGRNFRRIASTGEHNFVVVDAIAQPGKLDMSLFSLGADGEAYFRLEGLSVRK
jgi:phosphodiesterase/alkaline phosphatase D-like protein